MPALGLKILFLVLGLACIMAGVICIKDREAKVGDEDGHRLIEGFPAILVGLAEIGFGVYLLHTAWTM